MKLYATITNEKGKKEGIGSDGSLFVELCYKNKIIGKLGLYVIFTGHGTKALGYRVAWKSNNTPVMGDILEENVNYSKANKKCRASVSNYPEGDEWCDNNATNGDYCKKHAEEFGKTKANNQLTSNDFFNIGANESERRKQERITKVKRQKGKKSHGLHKTCMYDHDHTAGNCEYHD
ncbi:MAG: hypothetical protein AAB922_01380 [Patescibacteria group bacterium]